VVRLDGSGRTDSGLRTNVQHLPVVGVGDGEGGAHSTAADLHRRWRALASGRIVTPRSVEPMVTAHSDRHGVVIPTGTVMARAAGSVAGPESEGR
jgi:hypothetical protein